MTAENSIISTISQLGSNGTWFENLAVRPNGNILATRIDLPELWSISTSPTAKAGYPLYTFPNTSNVMGITEIGKDVYAVVTGNLSISTISPVPGTFAVRTVQFSGNQPKAELLAHIPDAQLLNDITKFGNKLCLITDSTKGVIWHFDLTIGEYSQALSHTSLLPEEDQPVQVGANGIKALHSYAYFTSTAKEILGRILVDEHASATGPMEIINNGFTADDFLLTEDGTAYIATNSQNELLSDYVY